MKIRLPRALMYASAALSLFAAMGVNIVHAGEIALYEGTGFGGRQIILRGATPSINNVGFNDRTASIMVRSGRWEVCSDDGFRGDCAVFDAGEYPTLDGRFNKRISSLREVDSVAASGGPQGGPGFGAIELFGQPNFRGRMKLVDRDTRDFNSLDFNDRTASMIVRDGSWELCTDADFRGTCRTFAQGSYPSLGGGFDHAISSARPVMQQEPSHAVRGGGWNRQRHEDDRDDRDHRGGNVELFTGVNFSGARFPIRQDLANFDAGGFNDKISSMIVNGGQWEVCIDANYRGRCTVFGPGRYAGLGGLSNQLSSIRRVD